MIKPLIVGENVSSIPLIQSAGLLVVFLHPGDEVLGFSFAGSRIAWVI